jgi:hypothetical protein
MKEIKEIGQGRRVVKEPVCKGRGTVDPGVEARKHQPPSLSLLHSAYKLTRWLTPLLPLSLSHSSQQFHSPQLRLLPFRPPPKPFEIAAKEGRVRGLRPVFPPESAPGRSPPFLDPVSSCLPSLRLSRSPARFGIRRRCWIRVLGLSGSSGISDSRSPLFWCRASGLRGMGPLLRGIPSTSWWAAA